MTRRVLPYLFAAATGLLAPQAVLAAPITALSGWDTPPPDAPGIHRATLYDDQARFTKTPPRSVLAIRPFDAAAVAAYGERPRILRVDTGERVEEDLAWTLLAGQPEDIASVLTSGDVRGFGGWPRAITIAAVVFGALALAVAARKRAPRRMMRERRKRMLRRKPVHAPNAEGRRVLIKVRRRRKSARLVS